MLCLSPAPHFPWTFPSLGVAKVTPFCPPPPCIPLPGPGPPGSSISVSLKLCLICWSILHATWELWAQPSAHTPALTVLSPMPEPAVTVVGRTVPSPCVTVHRPPAELTSQMPRLGNESLQSQQHRPPQSTALVPGALQGHDPASVPMLGWSPNPIPGNQGSFLEEVAGQGADQAEGRAALSASLASCSCPHSHALGLGSPITDVEPDPSEMGPVRRN